MYLIKFLDSDDEIDDDELARLSAIYEKEYYGYVTDTELVEAMNRLLHICNTLETCDTKRDSHMLPEIMEAKLINQNEIMHQTQHEDSDEYY